VGVRPTFANKPVPRRGAVTPTLTSPATQGRGLDFPSPVRAVYERGRGGWGSALRLLTKLVRCRSAVTPTLTFPRYAGEGNHYSSGTIIKATMLMILISGLIAGPAVSL